MGIDFHLDRRSFLAGTIGGLAPSGFARAQNEVTRPLVLFDKLLPTRVVEVSDTATAQAALNAAVNGTAILLLPGVYEPLRLPKSWSPTAPMWLVSKVMHQAKIIDPRTSGQGAAIAAWKIDNYLIAGLDITGNFRGIYAGADPTRISNNVGIYCNKIRHCKEDAIKTNHINKLEVIGNDIDDVAFLSTQIGEGIDLVSVHGALIDRNNVTRIGPGGTAGAIFVKCGCRNITIRRNCVDGVIAGNGIGLGGTGTTDNWRIEDAKLGADGQPLRETGDGDIIGLFECTDSVMEENYVKNVASNKWALMVMGGHRCKLLRNHAIGRLGLLKSGSGETLIQCRDVTLQDNIVSGTLYIESGNGTGLIQNGNQWSTTPPADAYARLPTFLSQLWAEKFPYLVQGTAARTGR